MRILVISDVHGNLPALEYVLNLEKNADLIVSLGDVVNYGPWSNECVQLLEAQKSKVLIKGNHEEAFITGEYPGNNQIVQAFFNFCYPRFVLKETIEKYVKSFRYDDFDFEHTLNDTYIFPDTEVQLTSNTFIGHSHRLFSKSSGKYRLINAGSVGQNRLNIDELNYVIWEPEKNSTELITKKFSADSLLAEMKKQGYPVECINYIQSKRKS